MTNTGIIIGRSIESGKLSYLLDSRNNLRHFHSFTESRNFLKQKSIHESEVTLQYHAYCMHCGKEHFLNQEEISTDELQPFFYCEECESSINV